MQRSRVVARRTFYPLTTAQHVVDILRHDFLYVGQILVHFAQIALRPRICVHLLRFLYEGVCEGERRRDVAW